MKKEFTCIVCPVGCHLVVDGDEISGNRCPRGLQYAIQESKDPKRVVTSTVATNSETKRRLAVKTDKPIAKPLVFLVIKELRKVVINKPINVGDIIIHLVLDTDVNIVATDSF